MMINKLLISGVIFFFLFFVERSFAAAVATEQEIETIHVPSLARGVRIKTSPLENQEFPVYVEKPEIRRYRPSRWKVHLPPKERAMERVVELEISPAEEHKSPKCRDAHSVYDSERIFEEPKTGAKTSGGKVLPLTLKSTAYTKEKGVSGPATQKPRDISVMSAIPESGVDNNDVQSEKRASSPTESGEALNHLSYQLMLKENRLKLLNISEGPHLIGKEEKDFRRALQFYGRLSKSFWGEFIATHSSSPFPGDFSLLNWQQDHAVFTTSFYMLGQFFIEKQWILAKTKEHSFLNEEISVWKKAVDVLPQKLAEEFHHLSERGGMESAFLWNRIRYNRTYKLFTLFSQKASSVGINIVCSQKNGLSIEFDSPKTSEGVAAGLEENHPMSENEGSEKEILDAAEGGPCCQCS